jgi:hypothetical protein
MVIRDFSKHKYKKDLKSDLLCHFTGDYNNLTNKAIASVNLMNRLWSDEDGNSDIDSLVASFPSH